MAVENVAHDLRAAAEGGGVHDSLLATEDPLVGVDALNARPGFIASDETRLPQRRQRLGPFRLECRLWRRREISASNARTSLRA
jgi:hypothetical protein